MTGVQTCALPISIAYSDIRGGKKFIIKDNDNQLLWKEGNIDKNPCFNNDYSLNLISPCINSGIFYYQINDSVIINLKENDYKGIAPDIGAIESNYNPTMVQTNEKNITSLASFPNPFNLTTSILFEISKRSEVNLTVFSITGQRIKEIYAGCLPAGKHRFQWNGDDISGNKIASGIYMVRLKNDESIQKSRIVFVK